ncbi:MAG: hypothetical protein JXA96_17505 [Sedimentisphaerales bacterium]|nr:hypothetical protein [Sedimentisphaerales bacterium]
MNMTFPSYCLYGLLNSMGWPRITGLFSRRKVVSQIVVYNSVEVLVKAAVSLGAASPYIAIKLLTDIFRKRDWVNQSVKEIWDALDPTEQVSSQPEKSPIKVIAACPESFFTSINKDEIHSNLIEWESILIKEFKAYYNWVFAQGLVWGLSYPKEAIEYYEKERNEYLEIFPDALSCGLDVHSPETIEGFIDEIEELVNSFQKEIHSLADAPKELLEFQIIKNRIEKLEMTIDKHAKTK